MGRVVLTVNAGSSSLKFALFNAAETGLAELARGQMEGLGAQASFRVKAPDGMVLAKADYPVDGGPGDPGEALRLVLDWHRSQHPDMDIDAVGHRVVHGGPNFSDPMVINMDLIARLKGFIPLAPLHQPHNIAGVVAAREAFPEALQVACFDTAFHRSHPWVNDVFGLPLELYEEGVRRYGFHGLSYEYVTGALRRIAPHYATGRVVVAHLGNGASMCAIRDGMSVGSTMGFSALDGLPMGTRCGQIDPGVLLYLLDSKGMSVAELSDLLYKRSGLAGLSGLSHDMRELEGSPRPEAAKAIDYFVFRVRRELGGMTAILGGIDALVFTGGIGANAVHVRERICSGFEWLGVELDQHRNRVSDAVISSDRSRCRIFVIPTDEESVIAAHTVSLLDSVSH